MRKILLKEMRLSASGLAWLFILSGLLFFLPGYPVLLSSFFTALGLFKSFEYAREANDTVFSVLLPIAKRDAVKGRYAFVCLIELLSFLLMGTAAVFRMTVFRDAAFYRDNALMNANLYALGAAAFLFGLFNVIFVGGFYRTAYRLGRPFVFFMIAAFFSITVFEALHHFPGLEVLNAFGTEAFGLQLLLLLSGLLCWSLMTVFSLKKACRDFERIDL